MMSVGITSAIVAAIGTLSISVPLALAAPTDRGDTDNRQRAYDAPAMTVERGIFCFATGDHPALHSGKMRLETPHADVAVVGTRFILEVNETFTRVTVLEGRVELTPRAGNSVTPVKPGQAATATSTAIDVTLSDGKLPDVLPPGNCD